MINPVIMSQCFQTTDSAILNSLVVVVKHLLNRDYLRANDAYLEMAIGNAPWPIGVTMVGIHARTGREKISDKNVAHVLNDEIQRKYIQVTRFATNIRQVLFCLVITITFCCVWSSQYILFCLFITITFCCVWSSQ